MVKISIIIRKIRSLQKDSIIIVVVAHVFIFLVGLLPPLSTYFQIDIPFCYSIPVLVFITIFTAQKCQFHSFQIRFDASSIVSTLESY